MISYRLLPYALAFALFLRPALAQNPADTAFQQSFLVDVPESSGFAYVTYTVPHGKRLVIRYLAAWANVSSGHRFTSTVQTTLLGNTADFPQTYNAQSNGDGTDQLVSNQTVVIQSDGDSIVYFQIFRRVAAGPVHATFVVSGDLIPMP